MNTDKLIPPSWVETTLGQIVDYGKVKAVRPEEIPDDAWVLELEDIQKDTSILLQRITFKERQSKSNKNAFDAGDVLFGKLRPYLNKVIIADRPGYCSTEIIPIKPNTVITSKYIFYWLKHPRFLNYVDAISHGLNMPRLGTQAGIDAPLVLAPLHEQSRITEKLDSLFAKIDICRSKLESLPQIISDFEQTIINAGISGHLTNEWRTKNAETSDWGNIRLAKLVTKVGSGSTPKGGEAAYQTTGIPLIRSTNVVFFGFKQEGLVYINNEQASELKNAEVEFNDILLNITGASIGRVTIAPQEFEGARVNQHVCIIRTNNLILPDFLCIYLSSKKMQELILKQNYGATRQALTKQQILEFMIPVPSIKEQQEVVMRIKSLFGYTEKLKDKAQSIDSKVKDTIPALLVKAYCGALLPSTDKTELASNLLDVIRNQRAEAKKTTPVEKKKQVTVNKLAVKDNHFNSLNIIEVLAISGKSMSSNDLLMSSGFVIDSSADRNAERLEDFFVAIRDAVNNQDIIQSRHENEDWFSLKE